MRQILQPRRLSWLQGLLFQFVNRCSMHHRPSSTQCLLYFLCSRKAFEQVPLLATHATVKELNNSRTYLQMSRLVHPKPFACHSGAASSAAFSNPLPNSVYPQAKTVVDCQAAQRRINDCYDNTCHRRPPHRGLPRHCHWRGHPGR